MEPEELVARIVAMETREKILPTMIRAEMEGYIRGQLASVNENINATHRDLEQQLKAIAHDLHGDRRSNGLHSTVRHLMWLQGIQWAVIAWLAASAYGLKLPFVP